MELQGQRCMQFLIIIVYFAKLFSRKFVPFHHSLISLHLNFFFLAMLCGMKDLSSLTRDGTRAPCSGSAES